MLSLKENYTTPLLLIHLMSRTETPLLLIHLMSRAAAPLLLIHLMSRAETPLLLIHLMSRVETPLLLIHLMSSPPFSRFLCCELIEVTDKCEKPIKNIFLLTAIMYTFERFKN